jgi:hypothetical protein
MSTDAAFLDIEKAFDTTWQPGLLYKLSKLQFSTSLIEPSSFLSQRNFRLSVEGEMSTPRYMQARVPQGRVESLAQYKFINDTHQTPGVNLALFADDICLYATDLKVGYVLRKIQRGLNSMATWCESWIIKINEEKTRTIYFTNRNRPPDSLLALNGRNTSFVNNVKYLGLIFNKRMIWRLHVQMMEAKAFRTFIRLCSLFKSERLSLNIKFTLHKALIRSVMNYACPVWEFAAKCHLLK